MKRARHSNTKCTSKRWPMYPRSKGRFCYTKRMLAEADKRAMERWLAIRVE